MLKNPMVEQLFFGTQQHFREKSGWNHPVPMPKEAQKGALMVDRSRRDRPIFRGIPKGCFG